MVKPGISYFQAECIFPRESITHSIGSLTIRQAFQKLEDCHQCEPPWGESGLTMGRKQVRKSLIGVDRPQHITHLHEHIPVGKDCMSHTSCFFWNCWDRQ